MEVGGWAQGCPQYLLTNDRRCSWSSRLPTRTGRRPSPRVTVARSSPLAGPRRVRRWSRRPVRANLDRSLRVRLEIWLEAGVGRRLRNRSHLWAGRARRILDLRAGRAWRILELRVLPASDLGAQPTPGLGAGAATGLLGGRGVGLAVRASFDLNLWSTLGRRFRRGLLEARRSPIARTWLRRRSHIRQALDRGCHVALGLPGRLALGRSTRVGRRSGRTLLGLATRHTGAGWSRGRRWLAIPHRGRRVCRAASSSVAVVRSRRRLRARAALAGHPGDGLGGLVALVRCRRSHLRSRAVSGGLAVRRC